MLRNRTCLGETGLHKFALCAREMFAQYENVWNASALPFDLKSMLVYSVYAHVSTGFIFGKQLFFVFEFLRFVLKNCLAEIYIAT